MSAWEEIYDGGSPDAERAIFRDLAVRMLDIQENNRRKSGSALYDRTLHSKMLAGVSNATLNVDDAIPEAFRAKHFQPGASLKVSVRFSNASAIAQPDATPDMRGAAIKIHLDGADTHDLLLTSYPVSHARNARQFVEFATLAQGPKDTFLARLTAAFGDDEAMRMLNNIKHAAQPCESLALQAFWSRGAVLWETFPVRLALRPEPSAVPFQLADNGGDLLHAEFAARLRNGPVAYRLTVQPFIDEATTPLEDGGVQWSEEASAPVEIATLFIPVQDIDEPTGIRQAEEVNGMAFNPWNAPPEFRPLGNLNRVRGVVYGQSAKRWQSGS